ncbi:MAG: MFS transporter [Hyphomonadaceae bacterium]
MTSADAPQRPKTPAVLAALSRPKTRAMAVFGFAAGLPYAMVIGTLNAWLGEAGVNLATIGVLSWVGLAYAFKFLWSPAVDRIPPPFLKTLGRRRGWILICQGLIAASLALIASLNPGTQLGLFALAAVLAAFASATQDIVIDAWRIEAADDGSPLDLMSAVYQFGYRVAALVGGAGALMLAARLSWNGVYAAGAVIMLLALIGALMAPEPETPPLARRLGQHLIEPGALAPRVRNAALIAVLIGWGWAIATLGMFMASVVAADPADPQRPSARDFMAHTGPWIIVATVIFPAFISAGLDWMRRHGRNTLTEPLPRPTGAQAALDHLYGAILEPLAELVGRMRFAAILVLALILLYRITDSIWGPLAFPFYLTELKYTNDEVAFASKIFGTIMTIAGIALGGVALVRIGRMASVTIGAAIAAASNLLYADLARGGQGLDAFLHVTGLSALLGVFGLDDRMGRLLLAISGENIAGGFAGAAFVAYLSAIVSRDFSAVQYALLSSLTLLVGSLGRGPVGEAAQTMGYAPVFDITALIGLAAVALCLAEWARQGMAARKAALAPGAAQRSQV